MTTLIRRASLLLIPALALALPAGASASMSKAQKRSLKSFSVKLNTAHTQWASLRGPAVNRARAAGQQVAEKCLPAMEAAGKADNYTASLYLANGYGAVQQGATEDLLSPLRAKVADNSDKVLTLGSEPADSPQYLAAGLDGGLQAMEAMDGWYMTPDEICESATSWQAKGFSRAGTPRSLKRTMAAIQAWASAAGPVADPSYRKLLRRYGTTPRAYVSYAMSYYVEVPGQENEPVMKALNSGQEGDRLE